MGGFFPLDIIDVKKVSKELGYRRRLWETRTEVGKGILLWQRSAFVVLQSGRGIACAKRLWRAGGSNWPSPAQWTRVNSRSLAGRCNEGPAMSIAGTRDRSIGQCPVAGLSLTLDTTVEDMLVAWDLSPAVKAAQNKGIERRRLGRRGLQCEREKNWLGGSGRHGRMLPFLREGQKFSWGQ